MEAHSLAHSGGGLAVPRSRKLLAAFGDERLVEQLRRGNEVAFEVLYDRHHRGVLSYCRHMLGSRDEAEDALQQAFLSAHGDIVASDKPIRFKAWIYTIARNRCLSMLRARREQPSEDLERISTAGLGEEVQQRADLQELLVDMQDLPEDQRAALILSELGDLSHAEVAEVIGCEAAKVKSLVFQARSGLMERRQARETPCEEIREQLSTLRGGSLRRGPLRRHLKACPGCTDFREEVKRQRQMMAIVLPVIPTLGLRESALAAVGIGAGTGGGGGLAAGGGFGAAIAAKTGAAKLAVVAIATSSVVGGGVAIEKATTDGGSSRATQSQAGAPEGASLADPPAHQEIERAGEDAAATLKAGDGKREGKRDGRDAGKKGDGRKNGFQPERGTSNGDRAREFARGRGRGRKRGLDKQRVVAGASRGRANGRGRGKGAERRRGARRESAGPQSGGRPSEQAGGANDPLKKPLPNPLKPETPPASGLKPDGAPDLKPTLGLKAERTDQLP